MGGKDRKAAAVSQSSKKRKRVVPSAVMLTKRDMLPPSPLNQVGDGQQLWQGCPPPTTYHHLKKRYPNSPHPSSVSTVLHDYKFYIYSQCFTVSKSKFYKFNTSFLYRQQQNSIQKSLLLVTTYSHLSPPFPLNLLR